MLYIKETSTWNMENYFCYPLHHLKNLILSYQALMIAMFSLELALSTYAALGQLFAYHYLAMKDPHPPCLQLSQ